MKRRQGRYRGWETAALLAIGGEGGQAASISYGKQKQQWLHREQRQQAASQISAMEDIEEGQRPAGWPVAVGKCKQYP
jgi:hypothetical protein